MVTRPESLRPADCFDDLPLVAQDVARGVTRLFFRSDMFALCEVPLPNGRRADLLAIGPKGQLAIVEIKVSRADLLGDQKWTDYLDYCDLYWAVPTPTARTPGLSETAQRGIRCRTTSTSLSS